MSKYEPKTTIEKLGWVIEECGELQAAIGKTIRHGLTSCDPTDGAKRTASGERELNVDWILREMFDVEKAIRLARTAIIRDVDESDPPRVDPAAPEVLGFGILTNLLRERDEARTEVKRLRVTLDQLKELQPAVLAEAVEHHRQRQTLETIVARLSTEYGALRESFRTTLLRALDITEEMAKEIGTDRFTRQHAELREALSKLT